MDTWEYRTLHLQYGEQKNEAGKKIKGWYCTWSNTTPTLGLDEILASEGKAGWELVNIIPNSTFESFGRVTVTDAVAIFKRK